MKKYILASLVLGFSFAASAQEKGITPEVLKKISAKAPATAAERALAGAVATNDIKTLAAALDNPIPGGTNFTYRVNSKGITNQKGSGRCWLFTGLNVLRAKMIQKYGLGEFTFSQSYIFFYDQLEKCNLFLQATIDNADKPRDDRTVDWLFQNPLSDGGQFTGVADLFTKYGVVPSEAMPEHHAANYTFTYAMLLKTKLREYGLRLREMRAAGKKAKDLAAAKEEMLTEVYRMLVLCFGEPPTEFEWTRRDKSGKAVETKKYTPKSFYDEYVAADLQNNYVMFMNDPNHEYYKTYEIDLDRHVYDGRNWCFVNVPMEDLKAMAIESIKDSTMMYLSCDVGKFSNSTTGYNDERNFNYADVLGTTFPMNKKERINTYASASTHAMSLMAVDLNADGTPRKWMVENSWGASSGYQGHIIMSDQWFSDYVFRLVVEKRYIPEKLLKLTEQKPIMLPAWDPLFAPEN